MHADLFLNSKTAFLTLFNEAKVPGPAIHPPAQAIPSSKYPFFLPALANLISLTQSCKVETPSTLISLEGSISAAVFLTASATPPAMA